MHRSYNNCYLKITRDKVCQSTDESMLSAIMSEPLPMHGIHYWEFKIRASRDQTPEQPEAIPAKQEEDLETGMSQQQPFFFGGAV